MKLNKLNNIQTVIIIALCILFLAYPTKTKADHSMCIQTHNIAEMSINENDYYQLEINDGDYDKMQKICDEVNFPLTFK